MHRTCCFFRENFRDLVNLRFLKIRDLGDKILDKLNDDWKVVCKTIKLNIIYNLKAYVYAICRQRR